MRGKNAAKFFAVVLGTLILTIITFTGLPNFFKPSEGDLIKSYKQIRTGIDIRGGVSAKLQPAEGAVPKEGDLESVQTLIEKRLSNQNILDYFVTIDKSKNRVLVDIPWRQDEKDFDPVDLINNTIEMAKLSFQEVKYVTETPETNEETEKKDKKKDKKSDKPNYYEIKNDEGDVVGLYEKVGEVVLEGIDVKNAKPDINPENGNKIVTLELKAEGVKKWADATGRIAAHQGQIGIFMDEELISAPQVNQRIDSDTCYIEGDFTQDEVKDLAYKIKSGNLPFKLEVVDLNTISPTLGNSAYNLTGIALVIALLLVIIFMIIVYKLPGIVASVALITLTVLQLLFISSTGITITLPGMAGIILAIGMGVDANVLIFERIKEELALGKTLKASIDAGFNRALAAVVDGNATAIISAGVLYYFFDSGAIRSFAITSLLGVLFSFLTAVTFTRWMLVATADIDIFKNPKLFGLKSTAREEK